MNNHRLFEYISLLNTATDYDQIHQIVTAYCNASGFSHFIYGARIPTSLINPSYLILSGYPAEWRDHYTEKEYITIDPTVTHCFNNTTPICWEQIIKTTCREDGTVNKLFSEADDFELRNGVSYPVHSIHGASAMFSLSTVDAPNKSQAHIQHELANGHLFACYVHEAIARASDNTVLTKVNSQLTKREKECLLWTTEGKTSWEISLILNISERTVVFHLNNAVKKLNVSNKQHAIARAISLGHITPSL